jgi:hypothetical protein
MTNRGQLSSPQEVEKSQIWWYMPVIPAFKRLRQEDLKF